MAVCKSCKCEEKLCGCADKAIPVSPPCGQDVDYCPEPEPCGEVFSTSCIVYTGNDIVDTNINQGDRLDVILQKLSIWLTNPACIDNVGNCFSPLGLRTTFISQTIIKISWDPGSGASQYYVQYKPASALTWTTFLPVASTVEEYTISGLTANTEYYVRVYSSCPPVPPNAGQICNSVTLSVTTLQS